VCKFFEKSKLDAGQDTGQDAGQGPRQAAGQVANVETNESNQQPQSGVPVELASSPDPYPELAGKTGLPAAKESDPLAASEACEMQTTLADMTIQQSEEEEACPTCPNHKVTVLEAPGEDDGNLCHGCLLSRV